MNLDLTFITNEPDRNLLDRFKILIKDTKFFDVLVGYFFTSGFYAIYKSLENTEKIRILIGICTNKETLELISQSRSSFQQTFQFSHAEVKEQFSEGVMYEMENSEDSREIEDGVTKMRLWLMPNRSLRNTVGYF